MNEERAYEQVASEMSANNLRPGLMAKAYAESAGNTNVAKSLYIKYRAKQIIEKDIADQEAAMARGAAEKAESLARAKAEQAAKLAKTKAEQEKDNIETFNADTQLLGKVLISVALFLILIGLIIIFYG